MDTGLIIAIAVVVLVVLALLFLLPKMGGKAKAKKAQHEIAQRRDAAAERHATESSERQREADRLEHEARARRLEAEAHKERATLHQQGLADETLVRDDEQDLARHAGLGEHETRRTTEVHETDRTDGADLDGERRRTEVHETRTAATDADGDGRADTGGGRFERTREIPGGRAHEPAPDNNGRIR